MSQFQELKLDTLLGELKTNGSINGRKKFISLILNVLVGDEAWCISIRSGGMNVTAIKSKNADILMEASKEAWQNFAKANPPVGYQSLFAMLRVGHLKVSGDMLAFGRALMLLEQIFLNLRHTEVNDFASVQNTSFIEPITGRYVNMAVSGVDYRVYFEEAGPSDGIPLLCLHTAGSDSRQYRGVLNDREITKDFRVLSFDLPWHGKSSPPAGFENSEYKLTTDFYVELINIFSDTLKLKKPIVMGCSIGGRAILHLGLCDAKRFRAFIGLQSALEANPGVNSALADLRVAGRPDVHGGEACGGMMFHLIAPNAPTHHRWETLWHYMCGGPGVFLGDINYYYDDGSLDAEEAKSLRNCGVPYYLLTGEFDLSATVELTSHLAEIIGAEYFEVMRDMGHFPMSEDPNRFLNYLKPILKRIQHRE